MISRLVVTALLAVFTLTQSGCIGSMALSGKVREFNMEQSNEPWPREAVFVLLYVVPAYPFAGMADIMVINAIEFWSGTNPISKKPAVVTVASRAGTHREVAANGVVAESALRDDGSIDIEITAADGTKAFLNLENTGEALVARDEGGNVSARVMLERR